MAADTYMSICIQCRLSLETKTTKRGEGLKDVMGTDEGQDFFLFSNAVVCMHIFECVFVICVVCVCVCVSIAIRPCINAMEDVRLMSVGCP